MSNTETETEIKRITFRLPPELFAQIAEYVAARKAREPKYSLNDLCLEAVDTLTRPTSPLARYQQILAAGRQELRAAFSEAELNCIMDSCNGLALWYEMGERPFVVTMPGRIIAANVEDSIRLNKLAEKWGVGSDLPSKIAALDMPAQYALADLIERFWDDPQATVMRLL